VRKQVYAGGMYKGWFEKTSIFRRQAVDQWARQSGAKRGRSPEVEGRLSTRPVEHAQTHVTSWGLQLIITLWGLPAIPQ
jgi:hypothetical protein